MTDGLTCDVFFRAATHPEIIYTVFGITPDGPGRVRATGELRMGMINKTAWVEGGLRFTRPS